PGDEAIDPATVNLMLLVVEAVDQVARLLTGRDVPGEIERLDRQVRGEARVDHRRPLGRVERRREGGVRRSLLPRLLYGLAGRSRRRWRARRRAGTGGRDRRSSSSPGRSR